MSTAAEAVPETTTDAVVGSRTRRWMPRGILALTMLFTGAAGLIYEYVLSTVFTYLLGSSIEQFSITIGIMFAMMGIGGWLQTRLRGPLVEYFICAELLLVMLGGFAPIALQWTYALLPNDFAWIKFGYPALIGILIGIEIPLIMRINERFTTSLSSNIAGTWAWDYIGGAVGVIAWIWMLRHYVPITHISFWVAACNLTVAIMSLVFFWRRGMLRWRLSFPVMSVTACAIILLLLFGSSNVNSWSTIISQKLYDDPIAFNVTTKFQNIVMTKGPHPSNPQDNNWQLYLNGNKQFSSADEAIYHEYLVHPAMNLAARHQRVLILGGGDGLAMREVLKYKDVEEVTLVDLDPGMIELAKTDPVLKRLNHDSFADARVRSNLTDQKLNAGIIDTGNQQDVVLNTDETKKVCENVVDEQGKSHEECDTEQVTEKTATVNIYTIDADRFLTGLTKKYDVVIVDLPDPNSVELSKLYSKEFYAKIKRVLSPDGMTVVQSTSPYHAKETFLCILRTMAAAGLNVTPYHDNVPSFGDWGWILGSPSLPADTLFERADKMQDFGGVETREIEAGNLTRALIFNRGWLQSGSKEISTLMRPVVFDYYNHEAWKVE